MRIVINPGGKEVIAKITIPMAKVAYIHLGTHLKEGEFRFTVLDENDDQINKPRVYFVDKRPQKNSILFNVNGRKTVTLAFRNAKNDNQSVMLLQKLDVYFAY